MEISNIEKIILQVPYESPFTHFSGRVSNSSITEIVRIHTDEGIVGVGNAERNFNAELADKLLKGYDPIKIEETMAVMGRYRNAGVEIALWDILGKVAKQPIHKLLGSCRDRIKAYPSTLSLRKPGEDARLAVDYLEQGFRGIKLRLHRPRLKEDISMVRSVRDAVGDDMEIMVDANQARLYYGDTDPCLHWTLSIAQRAARELEKLDVLWLEEPLNAMDTEGYKQLAQSVDIPIAGGEGVTDLQRFRDMIISGGWDIIQPDDVHCGGILSCMKVAHLAEAHNKLCILAHVRWAGLQLLGAIPNCTYFEWMHDPPQDWMMFTDKILKEPITFKDGEVIIPQGPGLGIELDEEKIAKYRIKVAPIFGMR